MKFTLYALVFATALVASLPLSAEDLKQPAFAPRMAAVLSWKGYVVEFHDIGQAPSWKRDETFRVMGIFSQVLATRVDQDELRQLLWIQLQFDFQKANEFSVKGYSERTATQAPAVFRMTFGIPVVSSDEEIADFVASQITERLLPIAKLPKPASEPRVLKAPAAEVEKVKQMASLCDRLLAGAARRFRRR